MPPHAWLFGAWTGGLFPPPSTLGAQECLALPVVIFTRDIVMRAVITDQLYAQRLVETARVTADGAEFRFTRPVAEAPAGPFNLSPGGGSNDVGFGCASPDSCTCSATARTRSASPAAPISPTRSCAARRTENIEETLAAMTRSVARLLAESLEAHDVDQIFCVPGESYVGLTNALTEHELDPPDRVPARGRRRLSWRWPTAGCATAPACCIVSRGPGLSNAMVSLHSAYHDATPMVMLVGQVERKDFGRHGAAGAELLAAAVRRHQVGDRGERAGAGLRGDRARLPPRRKRHAGPGRGDPAGGHLRREDRRRARPAAPARRRRAARARTSIAWPRCWRRPSGRWSWSAARCSADALHDEAVFGDLRRLAEEWVLPISPTHRRPQLFDATHPNYGGYMGIRVPPRADRRDEEGRSDGGARRAADRHASASPTPSPPRRSRNCRWCMSGRTPNEVGRVWRPDLGIAVQPA